MNDTGVGIFVMLVIIGLIVGSAMTCDDRKTQRDMYHAELCKERMAHADTLAVLRADNFCAGQVHE